jgi:hypothetical protein
VKNKTLKNDGIFVKDVKDIEPRLFQNNIEPIGQEGSK